LPIGTFFILAGVTGHGAALSVLVAPQAPVILPRRQARPRLPGRHTALAVRLLRYGLRLALQRGLLDQLLSRSEEGVSCATSLGVTQEAIPGLQRLLTVGTQGAKSPQESRRMVRKGVQLGDHTLPREGHM